MVFFILQKAQQLQSLQTKGETADFVLPGFPRFLGFSLYSQDSHCTPGIPIVLPSKEEMVVSWDSESLEVQRKSQESREHGENPRSTMDISGVRWESKQYNGNPGSTRGISGVRRKSQEYNGNPRSTMKILGVQRESQKYEGNSDISILLLGFPSYFQDSHRTPGISIVLLAFSPYSRDFLDFHCPLRYSESQESAVSPLLQTHHLRFF